MKPGMKMALGIGCGVALAAGAALVVSLLVGGAAFDAAAKRTSAPARTAGQSSAGTPPALPIAAARAAASPRLKLDVIRFEESGDYFHVRGLITNSSDEPVRFVKVEALYVDAAGKTLDTDWTYAVDSDPLAPGADRTFEVQTAAVPGVTSVQVRVQR